MNTAELQMVFSFVNKTKEGFDSVKKQVKDVGEEVKGLGQKSEEHLGTVSGGVKSLIESMESLKTGAMAAGKAFLAFEAVKIFFELAKDAAKDEALALGLRAVGTNAGYAASELKEATEALMKFGMTDETASKNLSKLISTGIPLDAATELAKSARTLAQQTGAEVGQVFESVMGAVLTGRTMGLKRMGIKIDEAKVYREAVAANGGQTLTTAQQGTAMTEAIAAKVQQKRGGFDEEGADLAQTKLNEIAAAWQNLKSAVGGALQETFKGFLDMVKIVITALDDLWQSYQTGDGEATKVGENTSTLGATFKLFGEFVAGLIYTFIEYKEVLTWVGAILLVAFNPIGGAIALFVTFGLTSDRFKAVLAALIGVIDLLATTIGIVFMTTVGAAIASVSALLIMIKTGSMKEGMKFIDEYNAKLKEMKEHADIAAGAVKGAVQDATKPGKTPEETAAEAEKRKAAEKLKADKTKKDLEAAEKKEMAEKLAEGMVKVNAQAAVDYAKHQQTLTKISTDAEDRRNKIKLDHGLMTDDQYWDAKRANLIKNQEKELALVVAEQAKVAADGAAAYKKASESKTGNASLVAEENKAKNAEAAAKTADTIAKQKDARDKQSEDNEAEKEKRIRAAMKTKQDLQNLIGQESAALIAKLAQEEQDAINKTSDETEQKEIRKIFLIKRITGEMEIQNAKEQAGLDLKAKGLDILQAQLDREIKLGGGVSDFDAMKRRNDITSGRLGIQQTKLDSATSDLGKLAPDGPAARKKIDEIAAINSEMEKLKGTFESTGTAIRENFTGELDKALQGIITGTQTIGQALKSMAMNLLTNLSQTMTKNLAQSMTKSLTEATGGGNGIFDTIGQMLGGTTAPKGTANDPLFTKDALTGGKNQLATVAEEAGVGFKGMIEKVTDGFGGMFRGLGSALNSVLGGGGGGGGILGFIGSMFGGGAKPGDGLLSNGEYAAMDLIGADGGLLNGPAHSQGGIKLEAEGGEYITKGSQTRKWLPLLQAINSGALDGMTIPGAMKIRKYASGGLVGSTDANTSGGALGGNQTNHIAISVDSQGGKTSSGTGDSSGAAEFGRQLSNMVATELIKQRRPGGLLA